MKKLAEYCVAVFALFVLLVNTLMCAPFVFSFALCKLVIPLEASRKLFTRFVDGVAYVWIQVVCMGAQVVYRARWEVSGDKELKIDDWYLVIANHQSWLDILVLEKVFIGKIPMLKFFIKDVLRYIPVLGLAWWAMDMPFMKRYSKSQLARNPELKGQDLERTRKSCEKFKNKPVAIMNYIEGTRFTEAKAKKQQSPYTNLLKPRAGGVAYALAVMGGQIHHVLDVTVVYPQGKATLWDFLCGRLSAIKIDIQQRELTPDLLGDYFEDKAFRTHFQGWLNQLWQEKQTRIESMSF